MAGGPDMRSDDIHKFAKGRKGLADRIAIPCRGKSVQINLSTPEFRPEGELPMTWPRERSKGGSVLAERQSLQNLSNAMSS